MEQVITIGLDLAKKSSRFMALTQPARSWCAGSCAAAMSCGFSVDCRAALSAWRPALPLITGLVNSPSWGTRFD